jgi:glycine dehydrogenase
MSSSLLQNALQTNDEFISRHIGPSLDEQASMLRVLGFKSRSDLIQSVVPTSIRENQPLPLAEFTQPLSEIDALNQLKSIANKNLVFKSWIGQGYYNTFTPTVIQRNILENPSWYTAYTPYQPEISQGRLEAIINFQQMIMDLSGMDIANASMLDEGTAAAEAMTLALRSTESQSTYFFVASDVFPQTIEVIKTRAKPLKIKVIIDEASNMTQYDVFGSIIQYPGGNGHLYSLSDYLKMSAHIHANKGLFIVATDLLALTLLESPAKLQADIVIGNSQRFGVPIGFGGPHAAFLATKDAYKRNMPGRLVGVSIDSNGDSAYRLALQTREQHIRREKATSNICTAQVLLAVIASMYAVYHGPQGLKKIALRTHFYTSLLANTLIKKGVEVSNSSWFDTLLIKSSHVASILSKANTLEMNFRSLDDHHLVISLDETCSDADIPRILKAFDIDLKVDDLQSFAPSSVSCFPKDLIRTDSYLTHPTFNRYHSEHEMLRYLRRLSDKDLALDRTMIPLGSCTMKLNATSEMLPISWPTFNQIHPFAPSSQWTGYAQLIEQVERMMCAATGYDCVSLQPNAGSQGEYAGLLAIQAYHESRGDTHRNICLIPSSAHGTNPASAQMAGMEVVVIACDSDGNIDYADLHSKVTIHSSNLAAMMITYPSTHGVFETHVKDVCELIHAHGGQVYIDGANMNALVGTASPGHFGGDVSHLNLHKTFCIPHGGGGPGVGPIAAKEHLAAFLPMSFTANLIAKSIQQVPRISSAPYGSASILPISWMYVAMMGSSGLRHATEVAILSANYIAKKLSPHFPILYKGQNDLIAHECILDIRPIQKLSGISNEDIAKRLIDFGFHAPTMSFPVPGTLMIEPTESESKFEMDRFIEAMISIREEIEMVITGKFDPTDNPLKQAPHTAQSLLSSEWNHSYSREIAAYPVSRLKQNKYWPPVGRIDNVHGDRNLFCACVPVSEYEKV